MIRILTVLAALTLTAPASTAQTATDKIRILLDQGDIAALDRAIAGMHEQAAEQKDAAALRDVYDRLFNSTHPARLAVVEEWRNEMPGSPYALAAETWGAIKTVEMLGSVNYASPGAPQNRLKLYISAKQRADELVEKSLRRSPDFVPTLDAWLVSRKFYLKKVKSTDLNAIIYAELMKASPDRASMLKIVETIDASFAHPTREILGACLTYADQIENYDSDLCVIEAVLRHHVDEGIANQAKAALETRDEPFLDDLKLDKILYADGFHMRERSDELRETLARLHENTLNTPAQIGNFAQHSRRIAWFLKTPSYLESSNDRLVEFIDERLADDPYNRFLIKRKIDALLAGYQRFGHLDDLERARALWPDAMVYGQYRGEFWNLGIALAAADRAPYDIVDQIEWAENAVAYSLLKLGAVKYALEWMIRAQDSARENLNLDRPDGSSDPSATLEALKCPMLRAARMVSALCQSHSADPILCEPSAAANERVHDILQEGGAGSCPSVSEARLTDLEYSAVPFESVSLPWAATSSE
ncbi:hypothetical protein [Thalassovita mangrovi]|uniref:DUF4034 domain-containing protein n=1 Tax=Thalassovita mangrovi TaxID=2692236 RepID=A0A6L8LNJ0_9RHOB|nr:hypothetical protein [Thalassovita mangrovi]MYM57558.1 hypothetical protein [Thalassovita mangrovi]